MSDKIFVAFIITSAGLSVGFVGVLIWAIIKLVSAVTG